MNDSATPVQPEYLHAWSLRCHPFEQRVDAQFFYAGSALMQRLDLLTHLVQFGESLVVVSGPPGSGKSTLLEQFLGHINPQWSVCLVDGEQGDPLATRLAETLGVTRDDEQALLRHWATQSEASQQLVIVVDNAEQLDAAACQRLCALTAQPDSERLRVVLFGTADTERCVRAALEQTGSKRSCQLLEIPRLTEEETSAYLMYRLAVAGYSGESPFTLTEVRAMCKAADGRPGGINRLAHESLREHHARAKNKKHTPAGHDRKKAATPLWLGASIAIAAVAGYLGWQRLAPTLEPDRRSAPPAPLLAEHPLALPPSTSLAGEDKNRPAEAQTEQPSAGTPAARTHPFPLAEDTPATPHPPAASVEATTVKSRPEDHTAAPAATPETAPTPAPVATADKTGETGLSRSGQVTEKPPEVADAAGTAAKPAESTANPETSTTPALAPATPSTSTAGLPHRENWLLQQAPGAFTLQLLGSRNPASINAYIRHNKLDPAKTAYYRGRYRNADWYVLLYGVYPDKASAFAARKALPGRVQKDKPWPRSIRSVQANIRNTP